jgi:SUKH-3 immunity protein
MSRFSQRSERLLKLAGWYEGRAIGLTQITLMQGRSPPDLAIKILEEFGGLRAGNYSRHSGLPWSPIISIDPILGGSITIDEHVTEFYPLGDVDMGEAVLELGNNGAIYWWFDVRPEFIAPTFDEALEKLFEHHIEI